MKVRVELPVILYADVEIDNRKVDPLAAAKDELYMAIGNPEDEEVVGVNLEFDGISNITIGACLHPSCDTDKHFRIIDEDV